MTKIGLLSDTHGYIDDKLLEFFTPCDEIWHAGDIGSIDVANRLKQFRTFRAVHGNIDGSEVRIEYKMHQRFMCEDVDVWITHIGGYPGNYSQYVWPNMLENPPKLFISGHSHILKVMNDKKYKLLHINPGAYGKSGLHKVRTAIRFEIDKDNIQNLEILEIKR